MKASELRIGNWVMVDPNNHPQQVVDVMCDSVNTYNVKRAHYGMVDGITLTEEWLLRFGFVEFVDFRNKTGMYDKRPLCGFSYSVNAKKVMILQKGNSVSHWIDKEIQYVHQLQNLYFELTGEELTYGGNK